MSFSLGIIYGDLLKHHLTELGAVQEAWHWRFVVHVIEKNQTYFKFVIGTVWMGAPSMGRLRRQCRQEVKKWPSRSRTKWCERKKWRCMTITIGKEKKIAVLIFLLRSSLCMVSEDHIKVPQIWSLPQIQSRISHVLNGIYRWWSNVNTENIRMVKKDLMESQWRGCNYIPDTKINNLQWRKE